MKEKLGGGLVPTVLEGVDHHSVVVVVADPLEHIGSGGVLGEGFFAPLSKGGKGLSCRCDLDTVEGDGFGEDPLIPRVGTSGGGGAVSGGGHASSREEGEVGCLVVGSLEVFFVLSFLTSSSKGFILFRADVGSCILLESLLLLLRNR